MVGTGKPKTGLEHKLTLKGSTLYDQTSKTMGVAVDDDTHIVFIQTNDNKSTTSYETGVKALETALKNLNVASEIKDGSGKVTGYKYNYEFSAYIEDGIATTVVIRDLTDGEYTGNTVVNNGKLTNVAIVKDGTALKATWTDKKEYNGKNYVVDFYLVDGTKEYLKDSVTGVSGNKDDHSETSSAIAQNGDYYAVIRILGADGKVVASATTSVKGFAF